jgi:hypothetical protein
VDERSIPAVGDPFAFAREATHDGGQDHDELPHACLDGWVYLGHTVESFDDLDGEVVEYERVRCRRCQERC